MSEEKNKRICFKCGTYIGPWDPFAPKNELCDRHQKEMDEVYSQCTDSAADRQIGGDHYKDMIIQPFEFCQKNGIPTGESGVIKYVCRHRSKNGKEDLEKAIHLIQMIIELEYS